MVTDFHHNSGSSLLSLVRFGKGLERSFGKLRLTQQLGQTQKESESYHKGMQLMWNRLQALAIG